MKVSSFFAVWINFCYINAGGVNIGGATSTLNAFPYPAAASLHEFTFDMYEKIARNLGSNENMVFSPLSMYSILAVLVPGLGGLTLKEVQHALRSEQLHNLLEQESEMCNAIFVGNDNYTLVQANRAYIDNHFTLTEAYERDTSRYHKLPVKKINFRKKRQSRRRINRYIAKETRQEITNLVPEGAITRRTKMFLVNSVYMEAAWESPFNERQTRKGDFRVTQTETIKVPIMMKRSMICGISHSEDLDSNVFVIPFKNIALSLVIFMPRVPGNFGPFMQEGTSDAIISVMQDLRGSTSGYPFRPARCRVTLPKFSIKHNVDDAIQVLRSMEIRDLFVQGQADFSRMTSQPGLFVSDARHEAVIKVTEGGVKATAASTIDVQFRMVTEPVDVNKPFMFLIRHEKTGAILFAGRVVRPPITE